MFTRCPHCETIFRITEEALQMAGGQVRCGRCTQVFDATAELSEQLPTRTAARGASGPAAEAVAAGEPDDGTAERGGPAAGETAAADWLLEADEPRAGRRRAWAVGAVLAAVLLAAQLVHYFRADLAGRPGVGSVLRDAYALVGIEVVPHWDLSAYRIRDTVTTAETNAAGRARLIVRTEIDNRGPGPLPLPHIYFALKDRWDTVVASRVFEPAEYLAGEASGMPLPAGATRTVELELVDPGPDAYGFELDVCVRADRGGLRCANDAVFR